MLVNGENYYNDKVWGRFICNGKFVYYLVFLKSLVLKSVYVGIM